MTINQLDTHKMSSPTKLNNTYFLLRHGESQANREGIIISDPETGIHHYGLTGKGTESVINTALNTRLDSETIIYSSDFKRARETAETFGRIIDTQAVQLKAELRERFFGEWEETGTDNYARIWTADESKELDPNTNVESVHSVAKRALKLVNELESTHKNQKILLVSHGDTLQILITAFAGLCPTKHRRLSPIKTAEIRSLGSRSLRSSPLIKETSSALANSQSNLINNALNI